MNNKVNTNCRKVQFSDLKEFLARRLIPLTQKDIADKTRYFGRRYSRPAVARFLLGDLKPKSLAVKVITETIEEWLDIEIDFTGTPYDKVEEVAP